MFVSVCSPVSYVLLSDFHRYLIHDSKKCLIHILSVFKRQETEERDGTRSVAPNKQLAETVGNGMALPFHPPLSLEPFSR